MSVLNLVREGAVWVLTLTGGESRFNDTSLAAWLQALDTVEAGEGNAALVITSADAKFFSTGIDLEGVVGEFGQDYLMQTFVPKLDAFLLRLARFPMPVVVAMNGHAYGLGALVAATADVRLMRADRGRFCFPEVDIKLPFTPIMSDVVKLLPSPAAAWQMAATGVAWGGQEAQAAGVIDQALSAEELLPTAIAMATALAVKDRATYAVIKRQWRDRFDRHL